MWGAKMDNSVIIFRDYGDVVLDIKTLMDTKNISVNEVVKKTGLHHQVVKKYYNGNAIRYDRDVLARLCFVLDCNITDIMKYKKD